MTAYVLLSFDWLYQIRIYRYLPLVFIGVFFHASFHSMRRTFFRHERLSRSLLVGAIMTAIVLVGIPSTAESFYWFTGYAAYTLPFIWLMYLWSILGGVLLWDDEFTVLKIIQSLLLVVLTVFNHELSIIFLNSLLALLCFFSILLEKNKRSLRSKVIFSSLFVASLICSFVVLNAPGNNNRQRRMDEEVSDKFDSLALASLHSIEKVLEIFSQNFILSFSGLVGFLILCFLFATRSTKQAVKMRKPTLFNGFVALALFGMVVVLALPSYLYTGGFDRARYYNIIFMFLLLFVIGIASMLNLKGRWPVRFFGEATNGLMLGGLLIIMAVAQFISGTNHRYAIIDLREGSPQAMYREYSERDMLMTTAQTKELEIGWLRSMPYTSFKADNLWSASGQRCLCSYYPNVDKVIPVGKRPRRKRR